jgi:hypothetical protein
MSNDIETIPACPPVGGYNSKRYREKVAENAAETLNVRDRATAQRFVIPPPPVDEQVPVPPPTPRRNFGPAPYANTNTTRRKD